MCCIWTFKIMIKMDFLKNMDHFGPIWTNIDHFGPFWTNMDHFEQLTKTTHIIMVWCVLYNVLHLDI
jgi:hypothetical protein